MQMTVVLCLEIVNITFMLTNHTISDIIKDFLALVIISDFDDYFYSTVTFTPIAKLITDGEIEVRAGGVIKFDEFAKIETTTSRNAPRDEKIESVFRSDVDSVKEVQLTEGGFELLNHERRVKIAYEDRTFGNKVCRVLYSTLDVFYQAFWYYFAPFVVFYLTFIVPSNLGAYDEL